LVTVLKAEALESVWKKHIRWQVIGGVALTRG